MATPEQISHTFDVHPALSNPPAPRMRAKLLSGKVQLAIAKLYPNSAEPPVRILSAHEKAVTVEGPHEAIHALIGEVHAQLIWNSQIVTEEGEKPAVPWQVHLFEAQEGQILKGLLMQEMIRKYEEVKKETPPPTPSPVPPSSVSETLPV